MVMTPEHVLCFILVLDSSNLVKALCQEIKELIHLTQTYKLSLTASKTHLTLNPLFCYH